MPNERKTENFVRDFLREWGFYNAANTIQVEEQKSEIEQIKKLLRGASKTGKGGKGAPEFIITNPSLPDFVIIIECKANIKNHESINLDKPNHYAVDGVLHY